MTLAGRFGDPKTERDIVSAKRFNFFALLVLILTVSAAVLLYFQLMQKQQELEHKSQELADSTAHLRRIRAELEAAQASLAKREVRMEDQINQLSRRVEQHQYDSALVQANAITTQLAHSATDKLVFVHIYAWKPVPGVLEKFEQYFADPSFLLVGTDSLAVLSPWMGTHSAVMYYSSSAAETATKIANHLTRLSGQGFIPVRGNSANVPQNDHHEWMHIHYLGSR